MLNGIAALLFPVGYMVKEVVMFLLTLSSCKFMFSELWLLFSAFGESGICWRTGFAGTCIPAGISPTCCSVKFRTEEFGFWAELVLLELRQELLSTGAAAAIEVGDSIIFKDVIWKAGMLTAFNSDAVTGMTPETEKSSVEGIQNWDSCTVFSWPE